MKMYKLVCDLPYCSKGTIGIEFNNNGNIEVRFQRWNSRLFYSFTLDEIKNNLGTWFEEVKENTKIPMVDMLYGYSFQEIDAIINFALERGYKKKSEVKSERWKPKIGETYFFIVEGDVQGACVAASVGSLSCYRRDKFNCFKTCDQAQEAARR